MMDTDEIDGLPHLTGKQAKFVEGIRKGLSKTEAYRQAYDTSRQKPQTTWVRAAELSANSKVKVWLNAIERETFNELSSIDKYTKQAYVEEISSIIRLALEDKSYSAINGLLRQKGQALGHLAENINVNKTIRKQDDTLLSQLEAMLGTKSREEAERLLGYTASDAPPEPAQGAVTDRKH